MCAALPQSCVELHMCPAGEILATSLPQFSFLFLVTCVHTLLFCARYRVVSPRPSMYYSSVLDFLVLDDLQSPS